MKTKLLATLCIILCLLALAACKSKDSTSATPAPTAGADIGTVPTIAQPETGDKVSDTQLTVWDGPSLLTSSEKCTATVDGVDLFVYDTRVNHNRIFSYTYPNAYDQVVIFDFRGRVHVSVSVPGATNLTDVVVRPLAYGVQPTVNGNTITFDLDYPTDYTLEYKDGSGEYTPGGPNGMGTRSGADGAADDTFPGHVLHIFTSLPEENPIDADNVPADTVYIGPGVYKADAIPVSSGQTVYLAGGAYVYGQIRAELVENLTIRGRGIISGYIYERTKASEVTVPIEVRNSKGLRIEGITILDPAGWNVALYKCEAIRIDNLRIIAARGNSDGISVQSCSDFVMKGGFVRTWDDSLVVKNEDRGTTKDITFGGVTVWTDLAQSCEVGYETNGDTMENITFNNITILHNYHKAAMSIHNSDDADITGVTYSNITLEDARMLGDTRDDGENDYLIDMTVAYSPEWSMSGANRGSISNITFENVLVLDTQPSIVTRMLGESAGSDIKSVTIHNITIAGRDITSEADLSLAKNNYVGNVSVVSDGKATGAVITLPYAIEPSASFEVANADITQIPSKPQSGLEVPAFAIVESDESYMGVAIGMTGLPVNVTHGKGTTLKAEYDDGSGSFEAAGGESSKLFDGDRTSTFNAKPWTGDEDEFVAVTVDFGKAAKPGVLRIYFDEGNTFVRSYRVAVFVKREVSDTNFSRALSSSDFICTPASGNYFDIKLSSTLECVQLQLRFFRVDGMLSPGNLAVSEIAAFPSSLSTNMPIVDSSAYNDVYVPDYMTDGNDSTYWEAQDIDAYCVVDMGDLHSIHYINLHLPPLLTWEPRTQEIAILASTDGVNFTQIAPPTPYLFDPMTGNRAALDFSAAPIQARYVKLQWSQNTSYGGYGAQLSEVYIYGE